METQREPSVATQPATCPDPELVLTHLDSLPTLSAIAVKLLEIAADPRSSAQDVVAVLRGDQSLTAKVLSLAGSAWTGVQRPVTTLEQAVPLLGLTTVRNLALAVSVFECFPPGAAPVEAEVFRREDFWKHALAVACASSSLARLRSEPGCDPSEAFVAGLLHDLGKVALSAVFPKAYDRAAGQADQSRGDIADFERRVLGTDHTVAGRKLAERWRLPRVLCEVIWLHHLSSEALPGSVVNRDLIGLVRLADTLAREQRIGYSGNHRFYEQSPRVAEQIGFSSEQLAEVVRVLVPEVAKQAQLLGLEEEAPEALYVQAITRANAELGRLNTELSLSSRRLAAGARYFRAISVFDRELGSWAEPPEVVAAMVRAGAIALQRPRMAAFGLRERGAGVDVCWVADEDGRVEVLSRPMPSDLQAALTRQEEIRDAVVVRAPAEVWSLLEPARRGLGHGTAWLIPVAHHEALAGGLVFCSDRDERAHLVQEAQDLRCFVASLGLAWERANAQAAARRLADDLADTNRRLQQMQVELLRSRTLSMIAEMAAGAGHELNGPLTVISGRAQMLSAATDDPETRRALEVIRAKAHECSQIVSELMDFARPRPPHREPVSLPELLEEVRQAALERSGLPASSLRLVVEPEVAGMPVRTGGRPLLVPGDREQLKTVFRELLSNAMDALAGRPGTIDLVCRPAVTPGFVEVIVRDTGCGMSPTVLQRAFDPFFSHRAAGRGRGLGLARAYRIIEGHGGHIWLESTPGEGTTAHVVLPTEAERTEPLV